MRVPGALSAMMGGATLMLWSSADRLVSTTRSPYKGIPLIIFMVHIRAYPNYIFMVHADYNNYYSYIA